MKPKEIKQMKAALAEVVSSLESKDRSAPIIIVIDELDRCRPTYAIKLLEEIKHLFDVPGLVFVFGMHGDQLAHSVKAAYGAEFQCKGLPLTLHWPQVSAQDAGFVAFGQAFA